MTQSSALLRCLLVPLQRSQILLPSASVVEVVPFGILVPPVASPAWLLGSLSWRDTALAAVDLDVLFDGQAGERAGKSRLAVVRATVVSPRVDHYLILTRSLPRLVTLERHMLESDPAAALPEAALSAVRIGGQQAYIPDLEYLEARLGDCLEQMPA